MEFQDTVDATRFLGLEFAVWLWHAHDKREGRHSVAGEVFDLQFGDNLLLEGQLDQAERCALRGGSPGDSPEAYKALSLGKLPTRARLSLKKGEREWAFQFDFEGFATSGVKIPAELRADDSPESFAERMTLIEELDDTLHALFGAFLRDRLSGGWAARRDELREWIALPTSDELLP
jgi:hypothetical protein